MRDDVKVILREDGIQVFQLSGRLTYDFIEQYKSDMMGHVLDAEGYIVDLSHVSQVDSTGMGLMVNTAKRFINSGDKMALVIVDAFTMELFQISKLDSIFKICTNLEEAVQAIKNEDDAYWQRLSDY